MTSRNLRFLTIILASLIQPAVSLAQVSATQPAQPTEPAGPAQPADAAIKPVKVSKPPDRNSDIYYKNKLEFSLETGYLPINIPFVYDVFVGDQYNMTPLKYTMVPTIASLRWQTGDIGGPWIFRGNFDMTFSLAVTAIPSGPETHYVAFDWGVRRNFVHRNWKTAPFFEMRGGIGDINAKEPLGVAFAQGQDLTFTYMMGSGVRYNFNSRFAISGEITYMHVSNAYLSEPRYNNYGINVYGPMIGLDIRLGKPKHTAAQ